MPYTRDQAREFWFDFDNQARFSTTFDAAYARAYFDHGLTFDSIMNALKTSFARADHPVHFQDVVRPGTDGFIELADLQLAIMDEYFENDDDIQSAFEDFGQGVLFDDRRPAGIKVHMMDGRPTTWVGYHRWHAFARAAVLLGANGRWERINRCIALAWAIQTKADPLIDGEMNPDLASAHLDDLRQTWTALPIEKIDWAFVNNATAAPEAGLLPAWSPPMGRYVRVQQLLGDAATDGAPEHVDDTGIAHGRFWELPYADFMSLPPIYGHQLIADPGPNRGERSDLVKVLKGPLPDGIPRMPRFRPVMKPEDIQFIQDWIDADCPEV
jgi:hypothetical protein